MKRSLTGAEVSWAHLPTAERTTAMPEICAKHNMVVAADAGAALVGYGTWQLTDAIDRAAITRMRHSATPAPAASGTNATKPAAP
jgi:hypothetical protein